MKKEILVSLITDQNDYQREQAAAAEKAARRSGVDLRVVYADGDAITQSQQLLSRIQSRPESRPAGIICQPVGSGLPLVAAAALKAGIGWAVLNRDVDYVAELWRARQVPIFTVSLEQEEVGRIQGRQISSLLPDGGTVLYIQGPAINPVVESRTKGMMTTKPSSVQVRTLRGRWTEESGYEAVKTWLSLATSRQTPISLLASQNDAMAMGARRAFQGIVGAEGRSRRVLPFTGCDAVPGKGREWVRAGTLAASIVIPPTAGIALETLVSHLESGTRPQARILVSPESFPKLEELKPQ
jgi:ribose transport system substrate-binding protein